MPLSDNEIIARIRKGEHRLYARLVDRYKDKAMTLAKRILRDRRDAEEAAQDSFVRAYKALGTFQGTAKFGTWFYRIVYNACMTKVARNRRGSDLLALDEDQLEVESTIPLEQEIEMKETARIMKDAVEQLPEKYALMLSLFYFQELSHAEICEVTQLPLGTVKIHLFRARNLLRGRLSKKLYPENSTV